MFHLGVPTTRALSLVLTGEAVLPDLLYDGHPAHDAGNPEAGPGGGCCDAGRDRPPLVLAALVGWFLARRRGTVAARG